MKEDWTEAAVREEEGEAWGKQVGGFREREKEEHGKRMSMGEER